MILIGNHSLQAHKSHSRMSEFDCGVDVVLLTLQQITISEKKTDKIIKTCPPALFTYNSEAF